jgi:hypothetical protein
MPPLLLLLLLCLPSDVSLCDTPASGLSVLLTVFSSQLRFVSQQGADDFTNFGGCM